MIQRKSILSFLILCFYFVLFYLLFLFKAFSLTQCFFFYNLSQTYFHVLQIPRSRQILSQLTTISTSPVYICLPYFLFLSPFSLYSLSPVCFSLSPCFLLNSIFSFFSHAPFVIRLALLITQTLLSFQHSLLAPSFSVLFHLTSVFYTLLFFKSVLCFLGCFVRLSSFGVFMLFSFFIRSFSFKLLLPSPTGISFSVKTPTAYTP